MTVTRQGWAAETVLHERVDGFEWYDVRLWFSPERQRDGLGKYVIDGTRCDLASTFKMQIRTNHQRIVTEPGTVQEPDGFMRHVSGLLIPQRVAVDEKLFGEFLTLAGKPLGGYTPWMFSTYAGVDEPLSGMWQHERYSLDLLDLADANIENYIDVAIREQWEGDKRGTTLNLQVGADADDWGSQGSSFFPTNTGQPFGRQFGTIQDFGSRFTSVTIGQADTINSAGWKHNPLSTKANTTVKVIFSGVDADNQAAPTTETEFNNLVLTTANTQDDNVATWTEDVEVTISMTSSVQEIIDRGSWSSGNALVLVGFDNGSTSASAVNRASEDYSSDTAKAPKLDLDFTAGGGPTDQEPALVDGKLVTNSLLLRHLVH